jgi:hypothetical protein
MEEHRLRVFENKVLMISGPKREEDGSWRNLQPIFFTEYC